MVPGEFWRFSHIRWRYVTGILLWVLWLVLDTHGRAVGALGDVLILNPSSLTFPKQVVGTTSAPLKVTVTIANKEAEIHSVDWSGAPFTLDTDCLNPSGSTCAITVRFKPIDSGTRLGWIKVNSRDAYDTHRWSTTIRISGIGVP